MKINKIKVNSYGKLREKEINLNNGINIIYGKNEAGKSTLLRFIINTFYGISKNKKGKEYSDIEKYTPWVGEDFSGKIEYELDDHKKYEVYRDFKKKNPQIFNENKEEISKQFNIDKNKGNEFFYEQTNVDEELFLSTLVVSQTESKLEKQEQSMLVQKISNLIGTGNDNVSYKRAIDRINRRKLDEIGTDKSREKPINILERKIQELQNEKEKLEEYENFKYEIEENKNILKQEIFNLENENNLLKEVKKFSEKENLEKEKIAIKENIKNENIEKIRLIENEIEQIKNDNNKILELNIDKINSNKKINKEENKINKKLIIFFIFIFILNILQFIFIENKLFNYLFLLTIPVFLLVSILIKNKINKKLKMQKNIEKNNFNDLEKINYEIQIRKNEKNILEKNNINLEEEIKNLKNNLILNIELEKEKIKNNYTNKIEKNKLNNIINSKNINFDIENLQEKINNKKLKLHSLDLEQKNIEPKLDNLSKIEEKLVNDKEKMLTFEKEILSFDLAKEILEVAYEKMKNSVTPKFTQKLSNTISEITDEKYTNVIFNDEEGLIIELETGNYIPVSKLSIGTIDQLYLSLRLSMAEELSNEKLPIILDEAFAYYDDERLKNILKYINDKFKNHQVIIFTCTDREKNILSNLNMIFNYIEL